MIGHKILIENFKKLAEREKLNHGYIFFGPDRVGKKLFALSLANYLENGIFDDPKGKILSDTHLISPDENGTIGIEEARRIKYFLIERPNRSLYRTVIINDAQALTGEAQNALLKITEEPSRAALIILVLKEPELILATIESRLHKIYFSQVSKKEIEEWLKREYLVPDKKATELAEKSFGQPGLARLILSDDKFNEAITAAAKTLELAPSERKTFIKDLVKEEKFDINLFLEALGIEVAGQNKMRPEFWHKLMELRRNLNFFNLNPRLQLEALFFKNTE
ncbi:MAG: hypothetical protein WCX12_02470 [Candidatus Paceibacterota bacterium]|jgi:DNA polymerase-3 subunit delta'